MAEAEAQHRIETYGEGFERPGDWEYHGKENPFLGVGNELEIGQAVIDASEQVNSAADVLIEEVEANEDLTPEQKAARIEAINEDRETALDQIHEAGQEAYDDLNRPEAEPL